MLRQVLPLRVLKAGSLEEVLGEDLNRIFIRVESFNFICPWVWLANGTNWTSAVYLPE